MTVIGIWLAVVGYGIAYAGMTKLGGGGCSIVDGFRNRCTAGSSSTAAATTGATQGTRLLAQQQQQANMIGTQPISQVA